MENTLINKTKFFALYWFQKVFFTSEKQKIAHKNTFGRLINKKDFLLLKPLSKISDEDANLMDVDYLRSKGYAIPYMGLSVKKQVEYGWIKLQSGNIDYFEDEGWGIFYSDQSSKNGEYVDQVQRIDELGILASDDEAAELARKKGFIVGTDNNPFQVISYPNPLLRK